MEIKWLDKNNKFGIVTFHKTTITMNVTIMRYFESAYKVRVGINDSNEIVLSPIDKNIALRNEISESQLFNIETRKSFSRISNKELAKMISSYLNVDFSKSPIKYNALWDDKHNVLIIKERIN